MLQAARPWTAVRGRRERRRLEEDTAITELLGTEFVSAYTTMRRHELQRFADHVTNWELEEYLELY